MGKAGLLLATFASLSVGLNERPTERIPLGHGITSKEHRAKRKRERQMRKANRNR